MKIKDIDIQDRPREKMQKYGASSLSIEELLAILINTGTKEMSAIGVARKIIEKTNGVKGLSDITFPELCEIKGIGYAKATRIYAALELSKMVSKAKGISNFRLNSPESVADLFMEELRYLKKEIVKLLLLGTKGQIVGDVVLSEGSLNLSVVHPREVFKEAIIRSANSIILIHNHPSGDPNPSKEDIDITKKIKSSGEILGIQLLDHIIIGDGEYFSLREKGYI